jgi:ribosomal protein S18 acetylase RimI-like enzyme
MGDIHEGILRLLGVLSERVSPVARSVLRLQSVLGTPSFRLLIARDTEKTYPENMVGMASVLYHKTLVHTDAKINDVAVDPEYRGQGIGEELVRRLIADARNYAALYREDVLLALTSRPSRIEANSLYLKLGFTLVAHARGPNGTNYYQMRITAPE